MGKRSLSVLVSIFLINCLTPPLSHGQEAARDQQFSVEEILNNIGDFSYVAIAASPTRGDIMILYDDEADSLPLVIRDARTGDCGPGNAWRCYTTASNARYPSLAFTPADPSGTPRVANFAYFADSEMLQWGENTYGPYWWYGGWFPVEGGSDSDRYGLYPAAQYDSDGTIWVAYQNEMYGTTVGTQRIVTAFVGNGNGNCGTLDRFLCSVVFSNDQPLSFGSTGITIDDQDRPVAAFYDDHEKYPVVAHFVGAGAGGSCGLANEWKCYTVPPRSGDSDAGKHVVPFVDPDGRLTLFYQNSHRGMLERATYLGPHSESNCGFNSTGTLVDEWKCETIDHMVGTLALRAISVGADLHGYPIVAYQYAYGSGPGGLAVVRPVASPDVDVGSNCGPGSSNQWNCQVIDSGSQYLTKAESVSLAVDLDGAIYIAYHEWDSYYLEHNLKLATMSGARIFVDGYESGSTSGWSITVP